MRAATVVLALFLTALPLAAADPKIENLAATASAGKVTVRFVLERAFDREQTREALQTGVPTSFTYVIEIFRDRPNWFDEGISRARIEVIATFNSVTREYLLNYRRDRRLVRSEVFGDLASLEKRMTTIEEPNLFEVGHRKAYKLKVRVKADLQRGWLLGFVPWDYATRWRTTRVVQLDAAP